MSVYIKCPSCGRLLADKELLFDKGIKEINNEILNDDEREQRIMKLVDSLQIPKNNYCCKMRIMTYVDLYNVYSERKK